MIQKYPIGIQDFGELRRGGYVYIDKTAHIFRLIDQGKYYFLSRPRRFGKSLLLSTMKEIFLGNQALFKGLWIEDKIDWQRKSPVIHLSFAQLTYQTDDLKLRLRQELQRLADAFQITVTGDQPGEWMRSFILQLYEQQGQVVILIDEYDKPIIDFLEQPEKAAVNRDMLKNFYSVIKDLDPYIRFFFLTGVSRFSKVSIFSDLNNLHDITIHPQYAALLGYTQAELEQYFDREIDLLAQNEGVSRHEMLEKIRTWYNGYLWGGKETVYNPFSVLNLMSQQQFGNFWFATGTPTFLVKKLREKFTYNLEEVQLSEIQLGNFQVENVDEMALLFQTGYLTIQNKIEDIYTLSYPNREVRHALLQFMLSDFSGKKQISPLIFNMLQYLQRRNYEQFQDALNTLLANIPYEQFMERYEAFYHAIFFMAFSLMQTYTQTEVQTAKGRIDVVVYTPDAFFVIEFKVNGSAAEALAQIKAKGYHQKYLHQNREVVLIGLGCAEKEVRELIVEVL
ncbi:ATP-binding protein [Rhodoflexus caldus]|uniref:ATP-binding protein n=1 Tax=Rhodoflexus caldus TaxID=2891236 RepID=UPI00202A9175|nr:ATP-binding protein [Rhodoflexus caldus]